MPSSRKHVRRVVDALSASILCCDCLERLTELSSLDVRGSLVVLSRRVLLNTWTPCRSCGAVDETYAIR